MIDILASSTSHSTPPSYLKEFGYSITEQSCKELFYNYALCLYQIGDAGTAVKYLNMFEKSLSKNTPEDEIDWITVKLFKDYMYLKGCEEKEHEARWAEMLAEYQSMAEKTIEKDQNIGSVILNNLLYLKHLLGKQDYSHKVLDDAMDVVKNKLSEHQRLLLKMNKIGLLLRKSKVSEALKLIGEVETIRTKQFLYADPDFIRNKYSALKKMKQYQAIENFIKEISEFDTRLAFCLTADLAKERNDNERILRELQESTKWNNEALKNYIFSLLLKDETMFEKYSDYLEELAAKSNEMKILEILLKVYENKGDSGKQKSILSKILSINPRNTAVKVKLAELYLRDGLAEQAEEMMKGIEMPEEITDINYLQYIEKNIHISKKEETKINEDLKKDAIKKRIKKKRKPRLPKNLDKFVEGFKGDPERWLPKWQRKGYKKKGRKGGKTQGMVTVGKEEKNSYMTGISTSGQEVTK